MEFVEVELGSSRDGLDIKRCLGPISSAQCGMEACDEGMGMGIRTKLLAQGGELVHRVVGDRVVDGWCWLGEL